mgnify:CR=1 FL=1
MGPFSHRDFRLLFSAQIVALLGTGLTTVALGLLALTVVVALRSARRATTSSSA